MRKTDWLNYAVLASAMIFLTYLLWSTQNWLLTYLAIIPWMIFGYSSVIALRYDGGSKDE